jgi:hypothetical protein
MRIRSISLNLNLPDSLTHIQSSEFYSLMNIGKQVYMHFVELRGKAILRSIDKTSFRNKNEEGYLSRNTEHVPGIVF